jgi:hypothetical protein
MKNLGKTIPKGEKFDAAICLGQVLSSLITNKELQTFFNGLHKILKKNGLFIFNVRNARKINEEYLNKLRLDHMVNEEKLQLLILTYNTRDPQDPNIIIWRPIYLIKENNNVLDLQIREHKLKWFEFSALKKMITENGYKIMATYSGPEKEKFNEKKDTDIWFVTTVR